MTIEGPGPAKTVHGFADPRQAHDFLTGLHEQLLADAWTLEGADAERRVIADRRAVPRSTADRRRPR
jgi:hypothetical protein